MDPQNRALHMREQLKQIYRSRLPNMGWCDDNVRRKQQVELAYSQVRGDWEAEATQYQPVMAAALEASSTDNEHQTVDMTLSNDRSFWSSTGHASQVAHEALLYELSGPACQVASIKLAPYRALYQDGYPVYPPMRLQVWVGSNPYSLQPASPWHDVLPSDALQTFALWPHAPVGRYLQVRMYGKLQKQQQDMQFYVAIRHADASGTPLTVPELLVLQPLLRSNTLQLAGPTPSLPATVVQAMQAAADFGLGPEQGCAGAATFTQQEGRHTLPKLILRPRVLRQLGHGAAAELTSQQEQQQEQGHVQGVTAVQRVTAGIKSILGRRGAAAAAVASSSEAGPSKRPQQQQQEVQQPPPAPPLLPQRQQLRQGPPLWLADEAAAGSSSHQQQQGAQGQQHQHHGGLWVFQRPWDSSMPEQACGAGAGEGFSPVGGSEQYFDAASDGDEAMSDGDASEGADHDAAAAAAAAVSQQQGQQQHVNGGGEDDDMLAAGPWWQQQEEAEPAAAAAAAAAAADMDGAAWAAAQRLHQQIALSLQNVPPWQHEQVLAELLADEPAAGRGAFRERLAHLQEMLQQQNHNNSGQILPAPHPPPVVAVLPGSSTSSSDGSSSSGGWSDVGSSQDVQGVGLQAVKVRAVLEQQLKTSQMFYVDSMLHLTWHAISVMDDEEQRLRQRYAAAYHAAAGGVGAAAAGTSGAAAAVQTGIGSSSGTLDAAAATAPAAADFTAPPFLPGTRLFAWQESGLLAARGSSCSSHPQQQWCWPASCFCEGLEADLWAAC